MYSVHQDPIKLLEIKACDGKATSNRNSDVRHRPQRTDELGADPDTAIYSEPPRRLFFVVKPAGRQQADMPSWSIDFFE
jgi:hypothetical protein